MLYSDYMHQAKSLVVTFDDKAKVFYLEPEWQTILHANGLGNLDDVQDMCIDGWYDLEDVFKLEVEKRNALASKKNLIYEWIYNVITATVDPAMMKEENDLIQGMIEFTRMKNQEPSEEDSEQE